MDAPGVAALRIAGERLGHQLVCYEDAAQTPHNTDFILAPSGMGTSHEAADNSTADGRKMNRRVEVKVLVSQGLVGAASVTTADGTTTTASGAPE